MTTARGRHRAAAVGREASRRAGGELAEARAGLGLCIRQRPGLVWPHLLRAALLSKLAPIEKEYNAAVRKLNNQLGTVNELDLAEAEVDLQFAQANLQTAEREYEIKKAGPDPDDVALAEARIDNAQAQLSAAEATLLDLELLAPFAGTITELYVRPGEWIAPGQAVLQVADLNGFHIETTDLNEIDVARIQVGDDQRRPYRRLEERRHDCF